MAEELCLWPRFHFGHFCGVPTANVESRHPYFPDLEDVESQLAWNLFQDMKAGIYLCMVGTSWYLGTNNNGMLQRYFMVFYLSHSFCEGLTLSSMQGPHEDQLVPWLRRSLHYQLPTSLMASTLQFMENFLIPGLILTAWNVLSKHKFLYNIFFLLLIPLTLRTVFSLLYHHDFL